MPNEVTKYTDGDKTYVKINVDESDDFVAAAVYSDERMLSVSLADEGECTLDVTGIGDYRIKVFRWTSVEEMKPKDSPTTIVTIK